MGRLKFESEIEQELDVFGFSKTQFLKLFYYKNWYEYKNDSYMSQTFRVPKYL